MQSFIIKIENNAGDWTDEPAVGCYLINSAMPEKDLVSVVEKLRPFNKQILIEGCDAASLCLKLDLDGVLVEVDPGQPYKKQLQPVREIIGNKKALGVICPVERHAAMLVSEAEPEFVVFRVDNDNHDAEIIRWYNELFLIQSGVVRGAFAGDLTVFDTDFQIIGAKDYKNLLLKKKL